MKKYIIWDFDGTLANTNDIIIASWQASFRHFLGHELPVEDIEATFGETLMHTIPNFIPGVDVNEVIDFYRDFQDSHHDVYNVKLFEGVRELLGELRERGCLIGIGTSRTAYSLQNYMRELEAEHLVDEIVSMNDVTNHKPHPETANAVLLKLMAHDKSDWDEAERSLAGENGDIIIPDSVKASALFVGDTKYDVGCANAAGIDSVLVGWSHYVDLDAMMVEGYVPKYQIAQPKDLLNLI